MSERCHICGAEMSHENPEICKNFHVQRAHRKPEQPKEYIIYDYELAQWQMVTAMSPCCQEIRAKVRSRPHPTPVWTDDEVMKEIEDAFDRGIAAAEATIDMQKHDAAIARKAREDVLDELDEMIKEKWEFMFGVLPYNTEISKKSLYCMTESLREGDPL